MPQSMFDREFFLKMEESDNIYKAVRAISTRARDIGHEEGEENPALAALKDFTKGRIVVSDEESESESGGF